MTQLPRTAFNERKASEVAFYFLSRARSCGRSVTKLRLMKWMYLAEKRSYQKFGEPLTGDALFAIQHGPVLATTLSLVERPSQVAASDGTFQSVVQVIKESKHVYIDIQPDCSLQSTDDLRRLSDAEVELLDDVWAEFGQMSAQKLETYLHDPHSTPEWKWSKGDKRNPIELEDLFAAIGFNQKQTTQLVAQILAFQQIEQSFA